MPTLSLEADTGGAQDGAPNVLILEPAAVSKLRPISGPAPQTDGLAELRAMLDQREYKGAVEFYQASRYAEEHAARILKPVLLQHLSQLINTSRQDDFTQLTERLFRAVLR